jgi:hypothetical protein
LKGNFHEQFLGGWAGAIPPGYPADDSDIISLPNHLLDQAHNTIKRKLFMMKAFHHPDGNQKAFLTGLAHLYNLIPYQRRALNAGKCGVEVEGGRLPTADWMLDLQILTSGGYQCAPALPHH